MPSVKTSSLWCVRVTAPWDHIESKAKTFDEWIDVDGYMIGYHIGGKTKKPHAHIALKMLSILQKQSLDVRLKKLFQVERADYSSKVWDGDNRALSYMFHDAEGKVTQSLGLTEEQMNALRQMNAVVQKQIEASKEHASHKVIDYVLQKIEESGEAWTPEEVGWEIQKGVWKRMFHEPGDFQFDKFVNEIMARQCKDEKELQRFWETRRLRLRSLRSD